MIINYDNITATERYKLMSGTIIPRPIAWIVTYSENGTTNIAPFSYFTPLSSEPPLVIVSIGHKKNGHPKDTLYNLRHTQKCTICMVPESHLVQMDQSGEALAYGESEADAFSITLKEIHTAYPPMIEGCESALLCDYVEELSYPKTVPVILSIHQHFIEQNIIDSRFHVDYSPIGRAGKGYVTFKYMNK